jgi:hypothetical protein
MVSSDLPELWGMADRILVMRRGALLLTMQEHYAGGSADSRRLQTRLLSAGVADEPALVAAFVRRDVRTGFSHKRSIPCEACAFKRRERSHELKAE